MSGDLEARMLGAQAGSQLRRHTFRSAQKKKPEMAMRAQLCQRRDEVDAGHGLANRAALAPSRPDDTTAIRQAQVGRFEHAREVLVHPRPHHELGVDRRDKMMAARIDELRYPLQRCTHIKAINADAENTDLVH